MLSTFTRILPKIADVEGSRINGNIVCSGKNCQIALRMKIFGIDCRCCRSVGGIQGNGVDCFSEGILNV
jgi:hypothetical protein